jgi:hypothetical protein
MNWQRSNVQAAASYLRERIAGGAADARTKAVYEGLLDVLEPTRRTTRLQKEAADSAKAAVTVHATRERRTYIERRGHHDRRLVNLGPPHGTERRSGRDRRAGKERRGGR